MIRLLAVPIAVVLIAAAGLVLLPGHPADAGALSLAWGDVDCSGGINPVDSLKLLKVDAGLTVSQPVPECPAMGANYAVGAYTWKWGDVDCSGSISPVDALKILKVTAGRPVTQTVAGCPSLGVPQGVTLDGDVVSSISGEQLVVTQTSGVDMLTVSSQWGDYFSAIGAQSGSVITSTSTPGPDSSLNFRMTAIRAPGADWTGLLAQYAAGIQAHPESGLVAAQETLGGKSARHVTVPGHPEDSSYYYAGGDTLYLIATDDADLASAALGALPTATPSESQALPQADNPPVPGSSPLVLRPIRAIIPPVCVAEPFGRIRLDLMAIDAGYAIPIVANFFVTLILDGEMRPTTNAGPMATFYYRATKFSNEQENIQLQAIAPAGGTGTSSFQFPVQHCLNGTWQDNQRVLTISQSFDQLTANITSGTLCNEEGGVAFSGSLNPPDSHFSGSDLKVCNPDDCVQAGLEPISTTVDYSAEIALDGNSISLTWESEDTDLVHDGQGNLTACTHNGGTTEHTFSIDRLTFGPDLPY